MKHKADQANHRRDAAQGSKHLEGERAPPRLGVVVGAAPLSQGAAAAAHRDQLVDRDAGFKEDFMFFLVRHSLHRDRSALSRCAASERPRRTESKWSE